MIFTAPSKSEKIINKRAYITSELELLVNKSLLFHLSNKLYNYHGNLDFSEMKLNSFFDLFYQFYNVHGDFLCFDNPLTTLKGCPQFIEGDFDCRYTSIKSLKHGPKTVKGNYECSFLDNTRFTIKEVKQSCKVYGKIYV